MRKPKKGPALVSLSSHSPPFLPPLFLRHSHIDTIPSVHVIRIGDNFTPAELRTLQMARTASWDRSTDSEGDTDDKQSQRRQTKHVPAMTSPNFMPRSHWQGISGSPTPTVDRGRDSLTDDYSNL